MHSHCDFCESCWCENKSAEVMKPNAKCVCTAILWFKGSFASEITVNPHLLMMEFVWARKQKGRMERNCKMFSVLPMTYLLSIEVCAKRYIFVREKGKKTKKEKCT